MSTVLVELPRDLQELVKSRVKREGFRSVSEYIGALIDAARRGRSEIEAALIDGPDGGPAEAWTGQEWDDIKQRVIKRRQD